jgi:hypothetical protein
MRLGFFFVDSFAPAHLAVRQWSYSLNIGTFAGAAAGAWLSILPPDLSVFRLKAQVRSGCSGGKLRPTVKTDERTRRSTADRVRD